MLLKIYCNIRQKVQSLGLCFSILVVPSAEISNFLTLKYDEIPPNIVEIRRDVVIKVNQGASPLFYKIEPAQKFQKIKVIGELEVEKPLASERKDAYFQLGVIYAGDYQPSWLMKTWLPVWLKALLEIHPNQGLGTIDFHHFKKEKGFTPHSDRVRDVKLNYKDTGEIQTNGSFSAEILLREKEILGLWFRSDGDNHQGRFQITVKYLEML